MVISLKETIKIMEKIKNNNPDVEVFFSNGHLIIEDKIITIGGYEHGNKRINW